MKDKSISQNRFKHFKPKHLSMGNTPIVYTIIDKDTTKSILIKKET